MWVQKQKVAFLSYRAQDLSRALVNITVVRQALATNCKTTNQSFKENMYNVTKLALKFGVEISMPRACGR